MPLIPYKLLYFFPYSDKYLINPLFCLVNLLDQGINGNGYGMRLL